MKKFKRYIDEDISSLEFSKDFEARIKELKEILE